MTLFELRRLHKLWKKRLRIEDWTTSISFGTPEQWGTDCGRTMYDPRSMAAYILIAPAPTEENQYLDGGVEQTLIHELLHLVMHGWLEYEKEDLLQERSINVIADALYWAYRPKQRKKQ